MVNCTFDSLFSFGVVVFTNKPICARARWFSVILLESMVVVVLAVIPVQEEERERAHDQEEEDPHPEASVVFDCLVREDNKK